MWYGSIQPYTARPQLTLTPVLLPYLSRSTYTAPSGTWGRTSQSYSTAPLCPVNFQSILMSSHLTQGWVVHVTYGFCNSVPTLQNFKPALLALGNVMPKCISGCRRKVHHSHSWTNLEQRHLKCTGTFTVPHHCLDLGKWWGNGKYSSINYG